MNNLIKISNREIGRSASPFIIAEMSGNHNQSLNKAMEIVQAASDAGVHAIKLQTYTADTITLDGVEGDFRIDDDDSPWYGQTLHDLYTNAHTPWEWHAEIMQKANSLGLICFSSPFDETAVDFLEDLNVPAYKIASFENTHIPLIKKVASTGKPLIISTGMSSEEELDETVSAVLGAGCNDFMLLKCTSTYPASPENSNIVTIPYLRDRYNCEVGLSDHTMGIGAALASIAHGATVVEKHLTLRRSDGGVDSSFSMEPHELKNLVVESERAWQSLGKVFLGLSASEKNSLQFRRSLYVSEDMSKGEEFTTKNLRVVRPGYGLPPKYLIKFIGSSINKDVKKGTPANWDLID